MLKDSLFYNRWQSCHDLGEYDTHPSDRPSEETQQSNRTVTLFVYIWGDLWLFFFFFSLWEILPNVHKAPSDPWQLRGMPPLPPPVRQFLEDEREMLKREKLTHTHTLTGKETESGCLQRETCSCSWRPGREISQPKIYTGKMRLAQTNQDYWLPVKNCFTLSKTPSIPSDVNSCCSPVALMVGCGMSSRSKQRFASIYKSRKAV